MLQRPTIDYLVTNFLEIAGQETAIDYDLPGLQISLARWSWEQNWQMRDRLAQLPAAETESVCSLLVLQCTDAQRVGNVG